MAVLELENMRNYVNGLHKLLMSLTKDSATETFAFAKLYVNESDLVVLLNAEVEDFNETGINIEPTDARDNELKVGVIVYDEETYNNAIKAISHTADLYELVVSDELDIEEVNPLDLLAHEGDDKVRVLVYRPVTEKIIVKVPQVRETMETRMVPLTFTQKLVMVGATPKDKENKQHLRDNFDALLDKFLKKKVKYRITKKNTKVTYKGELLAKLVIVGNKTIKVYLPLNPTAYDEKYRIVDCSNKASYQDVPACVKVTGRVSLHRAYDLIEEVFKTREIPENKKYVENYSYSKDIVEAYKESLKEKQEA